MVGHFTTYWDQQSAEEGGCRQKRVWRGGVSAAIAAESTRSSAGRGRAQRGRPACEPRCMLQGWLAVGQHSRVDRVP